MIGDKNVIADTIIQQVTTSVSSVDNGLNLWFYIALAELVIILLLLMVGSRKKNNALEEKQKIKDSIKSNIDFNNIINSSFHATETYNQLKVKCHPDRFIGDSEKVEIANQIFQEITKNKTNVKRLLELKEEAKQKLKINF